MKKTILALTILGIAVSAPILGADPAPETAAEETEPVMISFLGSSCGGSGAMSFTQAPLFESPFEDLKAEASGCSIQRDCGDGNVISCTGQATCTQAGHDCSVTCDGQKTFCPNRCTVSKSCSGGCGVTCTSCAGDCHVGSNFVRCDGFTISCNNFCPPGF